MARFKCDTMMQGLVPVMTPSPGQRVCRFVGDYLQFSLRDAGERPPAQGWRAMLRTNLGRADLLRGEILAAHTHGVAPAGASWRDIPLTRRPNENVWELQMALTEPGYFKAKAYFLDPDGWQHWPEGADVGISVHPSGFRSGNTIYCAFVRLFGDASPGRASASSSEDFVRGLENEGYAVLPPSGKLRDLIRALPHVVNRLGCRILHLLPVSPTPTTYARFGRFGSPYAALDLTAIDPGLVEFDKRTTGVEQFCELTHAAHGLGAKVFLDIVINHTGWGSVLQENHPDWFLKHPDGSFASPGAWGVTWEDLVELRHNRVELWEQLSEMFLTWCRRGVDGYRCDAGYKVPPTAWQYIIARVQQEFPETIFLLEGLGGSWETTENLLGEGGMQWAYSELFQNYSGREVAGYLDYALAQTGRTGLFIHYSETHDNPRLAARGKAWSLLRNRLCALTSAQGGFGFTCGVEWLAREKIDVHSRAGLSWGNPANIIEELRALNLLLENHPCFFDGAKLQRLTPADSPVFGLLRQSADGGHAVLILVNLDMDQKRSVGLDLSRLSSVFTIPGKCIDLLGQEIAAPILDAGGAVRFEVPAATAYCLASEPAPDAAAGQKYREARARAAWALRCLVRALPGDMIPVYPWQDLERAVDANPAGFLRALTVAGRVAASDPARFKSQFSSVDKLLSAEAAEVFPRVIEWRLEDARRILPVPPGHWLLIRDDSPFRASLRCKDGRAERTESMFAGNAHIAAFAPQHRIGDAELRLERFSEKDAQVSAMVRFLRPQGLTHSLQSPVPKHAMRPDDVVLLVNGRGSMARLRLDLGQVRSKYDCVLGANLHPELPVDRHVLVKRLRVWVNADGFISPLDFSRLHQFTPGPPAIWDFIANAGDGRTVQIKISACMVPLQNTVLFGFQRPTVEQASGHQLPPEADVRLTVRVDIEDRNFHSETKHNGGADHHFSSNTRALPSNEKENGCAAGFIFSPANDRVLRVFSDSGVYHPAAEWSHNLPHPIEASRGQEGAGDAYSPGWFDLPLPAGADIRLCLTAEKAAEVKLPVSEKDGERKPDEFDATLFRAAQAFVVKRGSGKTVIAGYPWFLDWGRDTFICARGLIAAGMFEDVRLLIHTFGRFEESGTLPNTIHGENASNRDTSDAPLWYALVCAELAAALNPGVDLYRDRVNTGGRMVAEVLRSIGEHYRDGTPNGIRMDPVSGLVWSPAHFTWMDTNYPACTPREGYPIEIQALWIRLAEQLGELATTAEEKAAWRGIAQRARLSLEKYFWRNELGFFSDMLLAPRGVSAAEAQPDDCLRSNCLLAVSLGVVKGARAKAVVLAALKHLLVPGALRSLAPLPVQVPLPNRAGDGRLLNDPTRPYWGEYAGDEDTRRKPAYHNGTAWTWTLPSFCEALALAWDFDADARDAARAYLASMDSLLNSGCRGHLPEILDGDGPHRERGCDAQAWGATEALRVWRLLK